MKKDFLFPHSWRIPGWVLAVPSLLLGLVLLTGWAPDSLSLDSYSADQGPLDEIVTVCLIAGLMLIAFSREKDEDEYVTRLRSSSLTWALIVDCILIIIATLTIYGFAYLDALFVMPFLILILFVAKFRIALYRFRKINSHEEQH